MFMMGGSNWISFFLYGAVAIVLSWATTGCRFGNYTETQTNPDQLSGYYVSEPKALTFFATTTSPQQKTAPVSQIPAEIGRYLTNPLVLIMLDLNSGKAALTSPTFLSQSSI